MFLIAFVLCGLMTNAQVNLQNGLVAYYPFNGNANDESGNSNTGTVNGATLTEDRFGNSNSAFNFNGIDDFIEVANNINLNITGDKSIICWYLITNNPTNEYPVILYKEGIDVFPTYGLGFAHNLPQDPNYENVQFLFGSGNTNFNIYSTQKYSDYLNQWVCISATYSQNTGIQKIYFNGILSHSINIGSQISNISDKPLQIGRGDSYNTSLTYFNGKIDDIRIYNRALTEQEIGALYYASLSFDNQTTKVGRIIEIPVNTSELTANENVIAYQFDFNYDNTKLEYIGNSLIGTLAENGTIQVNPTTNKLSIAWADDNAIIGAGTILKLQFKVLDAGTITPTITNALFNTTTVNSISNGTITSTIKYGDIDCNDFVQAYDAALAIQYSVGLDPIPTIDALPWDAWRIKVANVDGQGGITANDASDILKYTVGLITNFTAGKKRGNEDNAEVSVNVENGNIVFKSSGDLFGLNVFVNENKQFLGTPQILNSNMLSATNISTSSYAIGLASPTAPIAGETFMKIPFTAGQNASITFDMIVNTTNKQVTVGLTTGIVQISDKDILVYPNPANNVLFINELSEKSTVKIYDLSGKTVFNNQLTNNQINISSFQNGLYTIVIEIGKTTVTKKFIKL